jgi:hypothetical protein
MVVNGIYRTKELPVKKYIPLLAMFVVLLVIVSCKSAPKPEEDSTPSPEVVSEVVSPDNTPDQAALNALDQVKNTAEQARQRVLDFDGPVYFPSDWEAAEAQYSSAKSQPVNSRAEVQQAAALYSAVSEAYDSIFEKTIPLYAQDRENEILAARRELVDTGLTPDYPEYLLDVDRDVVEAVTQYEAKDYYAAKAGAALAFGKYTALKAGADAWLVREEIVSWGFVSYDPDNFNEADEIGLSAIDNYQQGRIAEAYDEAKEAALRYNLVLKTGWTSYAGERRTAAGRERQNALNVKANIAVKEDFNTASKVNADADALFAQEKYKEAAEMYDESLARYRTASQIAAEKRDAAEEAIHTAEQKMEESEENARNAEIILEGGAQ